MKQTIEVFEFKRFEYWACRIVDIDEVGNDIIEAVPAPEPGEQIDMWSVYGIQMDGTAFCIGDFNTESTAAGLVEYFNNRIVGLRI